MTSKNSKDRKATEMDRMAALATLSSLPSGGKEIDRNAYVTALDGVSYKALQATVTSVLQGGLGHAFFPSPAELRLHLNKIVKQTIEEADTYTRKLDRRTQWREPVREIKRTPEERARAEAIMTLFHAAQDEEKVNAQRAESLRIQQEYGMTTEKLAAVPDAATYWKRGSGNAKHGRHRR